MQLVVTLEYRPMHTMCVLKGTLKEALPAISFSHVKAIAKLQELISKLITDIKYAAPMDTQSPPRV